MRKLPSAPAIAPVTRDESFLLRIATDARATGSLFAVSTTVPSTSPFAVGSGGVGRAWGGFWASIEPAAPRTRASTANTMRFMGPALSKIVSCAKCDRASNRSLFHFWHYEFDTSRFQFDYGAYSC